MEQFVQICAGLQFGDNLHGRMTVQFTAVSAVSGQELTNYNGKPRHEYAILAERR
jgi:hypothetical protein